MANPDRPNQNANKSTAEGGRWKSEPDTVRRAEEETSDPQYDDDDNAGGITNRPLDEEVENQDMLPPRGKSRDERPSDVDDESEMDRESRRSER